MDSNDGTCAGQDKRNNPPHCWRRGDRSFRLLNRYSVVFDDTSTVIKHLPILSVVRLMKSRTGTLLILASLVAFAGCAGIGSTGTDVTDEEVSSTGPDVTDEEVSSTGPDVTDEEASSTAPDVTDEEARERALDAEERHITERLENSSCVESWSLNSYVGLEEQATTTNRTDSGVYVAVKHPYTYGTEREEADVASEAEYLVTTDDLNRVSGTDVSPC